MRLLVQTDKRYIITDVPGVHYERDTDTLVIRDADNTYNVVILESSAFKYFNSLLRDGYVDLSAFPCTIIPHITGVPEG